MSGLTAEQHQIRSTGIGASEVAAILGRSKYATPIDVYRRKIENRLTEEAPHMKRGRILERSVLDWYAEDMGVTLARDLGTLRSKEFPHVLASPDAVVDKMVVVSDPAVFNQWAERAVDAKALRWDRRHEFGDQGTDQIPDDYLFQLQTQMGVLGLPSADLAVLMMGGDDLLRIYHVEFSRSLFEMIADHAERFWTNHVEPRKPPPLDGSEGYTSWLSDSFAERKTNVVTDATEHQEYRISMLKSLLGAKKAAEEGADLIKNELREAIGTNYGIKGSFGKVLWVGGEDSERTDWKSYAQSLLKMVPESRKHEAAVLMNLTTTKKPSSRQLRTFWNKE